MAKVKGRQTEPKGRKRTKRDKKKNKKKKHLFELVFSHTLLDSSNTKEIPQHRAYKADSKHRSTLLSSLVCGYF